MTSYLIIREKESKKESHCYSSRGKVYYYLNKALELINPLYGEWRKVEPEIIRAAIKDVDRDIDSITRRIIYISAAGAVRMLDEYHDENGHYVELLSNLELLENLSFTKGILQAMYDTTSSEEASFEWCKECY